MTHVSAPINYAALMDRRPTFHANGKSLDKLAFASHVIEITDRGTLGDARITRYTAIERGDTHDRLLVRVD